MSVLADNARKLAAAFDLLRSWGWGDYLSTTAGWETRSNGKAAQPFTQATNHHTGSRNTATSYILSPRDRPDLAILANIHVKQTGHAVLLAAGPTSHAGMTHKACYDRIAAGTAPLDRDLIPGPDSATFSANRHAVGIEADGAGGPSDWTVIEYRMMVALNAALNLAFGWTASGGAPRSGGHKELTLRKPGDPWPSMGRFRTEVADFIRNPRRPDWSPAVTITTSQEDDMPAPELIAAMEAANPGFVWSGRNAAANNKVLGELLANVAALTELVAADGDVSVDTIKAAVGEALADHTEQMAAIVESLRATVDGLSDRIDAEAREALTAALDRAREAVQA